MRAQDHNPAKGRQDMRQLERVQAIAAGDSRMGEVVTECECGQLPPLVAPWPVIDNPVYGDEPTVHEYSAEPDAQFPHLVRGSCSCGNYRMAGYVKAMFARAMWERHVSAGTS